jgi:sec-independent protein translocase protein TatA
LTPFRANGYDEVESASAGAALEDAEMGQLGMGELAVIFLVALLVFGPRKLPELGRSLGKGMREFRKATNDLKASWDEQVRDIDREVSSATKDIRDAGRDFENSIKGDSTRDRKGGKTTDASGGTRTAVDTAAPESNGLAGGRSPSGDAPPVQAPASPGPAGSGALPEDKPSAAPPVSGESGPADK